MVFWNTVGFAQIFEYSGPCGFISFVKTLLADVFVFRIFASQDVKWALPVAGLNVIDLVEYHVCVKDTLLTKLFT